MKQNRPLSHRKSERDDPLRIKSARVYFIYSFLCNGSSPTRQLPRDLVAKHILERGTPGPEKRPDRKGTDLSSSRRGLSPYIALDLPMGYRWLAPLRGSIGDIENQGDRLQVRVKPLLRLLPNGGSLTFKVVLANEQPGVTNISAEDVHKLHHLAPLVGSQHRYQFYGLAEYGNCSLYELYGRLLHQEFKRWENEGDGRKHKLLCSQHLYKDDEGDDLPKMPWVVTLLDLDQKGRAFKAFCGDFDEHAGSPDPAKTKAKAIRPFIPLIAPLLYRAPDYAYFQHPKLTGFALEPAYYHSFEQLSSMNVEARLYVQMSRRSILCICGDRQTYPASYFIPTLLDMCELAHTRWHSLVMLHKVLDESLSLFTRRQSLTSPTLVIVEANGEKRRVRKLEEIVKLVSLATTCLEDPAIFTVSGDALRKLHEEMNQTFRLELLVKRALDKLRLLEETYHHGLELGWTKTFDET